MAKKLKDAPLRKVESTDSPAGPSQPCRILFSLSNMEANVDMFAPVAKYLRQRYPQVSCDVVSSADFHRHRTTFRDRLSAIFDHVWVLTDDQVMRACVSLLKTNNQALAPIRLIAKHALLRRIRSVIKSTLAERLPQAVVFANDRSSPVLDLVQIANGAGIPTILLQESIRKDESFPTRGLMHGQGGCLRIAAWGETSREYFIRVGVNPDRIVITGNPRIDHFLVSCNQWSGASSRQRFGIPREARVILLATNPVYMKEMGMLSQEQYLESILTVANAVEHSTNGVHLVIKHHMMERSEHPQMGLTQKLEAFRKVLYEWQFSLAEGLAMADAVLVFNSTVAIEASVMNKEVAVLDLFHTGMGEEFVKEGIAFHVNSRDSLMALLLDDYPLPKRTSHNRPNRFVSQVGYAAQNVATEIMSLVKRK